MQNKKPKQRKKCLHCTKTFWSTNVRRVYCSANCNTKHNRKISPIQAEKARIRARNYYHSLTISDRKNQKLTSRYGISLKEYREMIKKQDGRCAICDKKFKLLVDHCHKTNKVRSLLCNGCNRGLGYFSENPKSLRKAAFYVERFSK